MITQNRPWKTANRIIGTVSQLSACSAHEVLQPEVLERVAQQAQPDVVAEGDASSRRGPRCTTIAASAPKVIIIMLSTLLERTMPP